jgi:hypothetical protein
VWSVLETVIGCGAPEERLEANSNEGQASIYRRKRRESLGELWSGFVPRTCNKHYSRLVLPSLSWTDKTTTFPGTIALQPFLKVER